MDVSQSTEPVNGSWPEGGGGIRCMVSQLTGPGMCTSKGKSGFEPVNGTWRDIGPVSGTWPRIRNARRGGGNVCIVSQLRGL
jgi:hypothetical protein